MKKVVKKLNRALSVLLAAALVVGSVPETGLVANATELEETQEYESTEPVADTPSDADDENADTASTPAADQDSDDLVDDADAEDAIQPAAEESADNSQDNEVENTDTDNDSSANTDENKEEGGEDTDVEDAIQPADVDNEAQATEEAEYNAEPEAATKHAVKLGTTTNAKVYYTIASDNQVEPDKDSKGTALTASGVEVEADNVVFLYVEPDTGYDFIETDPVKNGETAIPGGKVVADTKAMLYTINSLAADATINVTVEAEKYTVTSQVKDSNAVTVTLPTPDSKATFNQAYEFHVKAADGYQEDSLVVKAYKANDKNEQGEEIPLTKGDTDEANGTQYTIAADNVTGPIIITAEASKEVANITYTITVDGKSLSEEEYDTVFEEEWYLPATVEKGEKGFTITLDAKESVSTDEPYTYADYAIDSVKIGEVGFTSSGNSWTYTVADDGTITADVAVAIAVSSETYRERWIPVRRSTGNIKEIQYKIGEKAAEEVDEDYGVYFNTNNGEKVTIYVTVADKKYIPYINGVRMTSSAEDNDAKTKYEATYTFDEVESELVVSAKEETTVSLLPVTESLDGTTITYLHNCVKNKELSDGSDLVFKLAPSKDKVVAEVTVNDEGILLDASGVYTVKNEDLKKAGKVDIKAVQAKANADTYTIKFVTTNAKVQEAVADSENKKDITSKSVKKGESFTFYVAPSKDYTLQYVSTTKGNRNGEISGSDSFTVTPEHDMNIYVVATKPEKVNVTVTKQNTGAADFTIEKKTGEDKDYAASSDKVEVLQGDDLLLKITPNSTKNYKVWKVTVGDNEEDAEEISGSGDVYTIDAVENATNVYVYGMLDESKDTVKRIDYTIDGKATIATEANKTSVELYEEEGYILTTEAEVALTITPANGYELTSVMQGETEIELKDDNYTVKFGADAKKVDLSIVSEEIEAERKTVSIKNNDKAHFTVSVKTGGDTRVEETNDGYLIRTGAKSFEFTVTALNGYEPLVEYSKGEVKAEKNSTYTYKIPANLITDSETINIFAKNNASALIFNLGEGVRVAGVYSANTELVSNDGDTYFAEYGDTVTVKLTAQTGATITSVTTRVDGKADTTEVNAKEYSFQYKVTNKPATIIVETQSYGYVEIADLVRDKDGVYTGAKAGTKYTGKVQGGTPKAADFGEAATKATVSGSSVNFTIDKADADKTIVLTVYDGTGEDKKVIATESIKVLGEVGKVTVAGQEDAAIDQNADTIVYYPVVLDTADADYSKLTVTAGTGITAELTNDNRQLRITTPANTTATQAVTLKYDNKDIAGGKLTVKSVASSVVTTAKTTIKQISATDTDLYISISGVDQKKLPYLNTGKYFYKVEFAAQDGKTAEKSPAYIEYTGAATNGYVKVDNTAAKDRVARDFDVTVTLVQSAKETAPSANTDIVVSGIASKTVKMSTRNAYYEDKLSLKKGTTTIYTGQQEVSVATPTFSKNATYHSLTAEDISYTGSSALTIANAEELANGIANIKVNTTENTALGKHTIKVTATDGGELGSDLYVSTATITVNVVRGIYQININADAYDIYKLPNKAATAKFAVSYNGNSSNKNWIPKSKKAKFYVTDGDAISPWDASADSVYFASKVKVTNGKITIAKDFDLTRANKTFQVWAVADDYDKNPTKCSKWFTVTSNKMELGEVVITDSNNRILSRGGSSISADDLKGKYVKVLYPNVQLKNVYNNKDFMSTENIVFTASNKNIKIEKSGYISSAVAAKNVTITATVADGSKVAAKLTKLTVTPANAEIGLNISGNTKSGVNTTISAKGDDTAITYSANGTTTFTLNLATKGTNGWESVNTYPNFADYSIYSYTIAVKNAKIVTKQNKQAYTIVPTAKVATVTLTNKAKGNSKKVYTLTNTAFVDTRGAKTPKVTVSGVLTAGTATQAAINEGTVVRSIKLKTTGSYRYAFVKFDPVAYAAANKSPWVYDSVDYANDKDLINGYVVDVKDGEAELVFNTRYIPAGSYKLQVTYGSSFDEQGSLISDVKTANVTIKAAKAANVSYNLTKKYTMSMIDKSTVKLTGKGNKSFAGITFNTRLQNANNKGKINAFTSIFSVTEDGYLSINPKVKAENLVKENYTGYVTYTLTDIAGNTTEKTDKITIDIKTDKGVAKFTTDNIKVMTGITTAEAQIKCDKEAVQLVKNSVKIESADGIKLAKTALAADAKTINLTDIPEKVGTYKVTFTFKPATGINAAEVSVQGKVTVVKTDATKKISFKDSKADLGSADYAPAKDGKSGYYTVKVPYNMDIAVDAAKVEFKAVNSYLEIVNDDKTREAEIRVYRSSVTDAIAKKTIKEKITVTAGEGTKADTLYLNVTYPETVLGYNEIVSAVDAEDLNKNLVLKVKDAETTDSDEKKQIIDTAIGKVRDVFNQYIDKSGKSDVSLSVVQTTDADGKLKDYAVATQDEDGAVYITATLTNTAAAATDTDKTKKYDFVLKVKTGEESAGGIAEKIESYDYTDEYNNGSGKEQEATNDTTESEVISDLKAYLNLNADQRLMIIDYQMTKAASDSGSISFRAGVRNVVTGNFTGWTYKYITIDSINETTLTAIVSSVKAGFGVAGGTLINDPEGAKVFANTKYANDVVAGDGAEDAIKTAIESYLKDEAVSPIRGINVADVEFTFVPQKVSVKNGDVTTIEEHDIDLVTTEGKAIFELAISNPGSLEDPDKIATTGEISLTISSVPAFDAIKTGVKAITPATDKYDDTNTIASLNDAEKIKAAIEERVAGIIKNNKSVTAEVTVSDFVAASYENAYKEGGIYYPENPNADDARTSANGSFKWNVALTGSADGSGDGPVFGEAEVLEVTITASDSYQTLEEVQKELENVGNWAFVFTGKNEAEIKNALEEKINEQSDTLAVNESFEFAVAKVVPANGDFKNKVPDIEFTAPTVKEEGSVSANLVITDKSDKDNPTKTTYKLEVTVSKVKQNTANDAKTAAEKAVKDVEVTFADFDKDGKGLSSKQTELVDAAKDVIDTDTYDVAVKTGEELALVAGSATNDAHYTITISIKDKKSSSTEDLEVTDGKLTQSMSDAETQAKAALAALAKDGLASETAEVQAKKAVTDAVKAVLIKQGDKQKYVVQWGIDAEKAVYKAATAEEDGSITGKLYITNTAATPKEKSSAIDVNITIKKADSSSGGGAS